MPENTKLSEPTALDAVMRYIAADPKDAKTGNSALRALFGGDAERAGMTVDLYLAQLPIQVIVSKNILRRSLRRFSICLRG